jgi:hypothetical protein
MPAVITAGYWAEVYKNSIVSSLNASLFSFSDPDNSVVFQYGTPLTDSNFVGTPVPEPSSLTLFGAGGPGIAGLIRRLTLRITSLVGPGDSGLLAFLRLRDAVE